MDCDLIDRLKTDPEEGVALLLAQYEGMLRYIARGVLRDERELLYRRFYYLQSTAQIAAELGLSERSVEGRIYRLRRKLQKRLGGEGR